ncbi:MAG: S16 family serine protease [Solirubrobacteraceae bacterium]
MSHEHALNREIRQYWETGGDDIGKAQGVLSQALTHPPSRPDVLARVVTVADRADAEGFRKSITPKLVEPLARKRSLMALIDVLGDDDIAPAAAVFDHLAPEVDEELLLGADLSGLDGVRAGAASRPAAAQALLDALAWERLGASGPEIREVLDALTKSASAFGARLLLVSSDREAAVCLGVNVLDGYKPGIHGIDEVDVEMNKQAATVLSAFEAQHPAIRWSLEWPLRYEGESIGLALRLAALVAFKNVRPDPLLAATGAVAADGRVCHVEGVAVKLRAARDAGMRRVLLPRENHEEAMAAGVEDDVQLLFVDHIDDIQKRLAESTSADEMTFDGRLRMARSALKQYGLAINDEKALVSPFAAVRGHRRQRTVDLGCLQVGQGRRRWTQRSDQGSRQPVA